MISKKYACKYSVLDFNQIIEVVIDGKQNKDNEDWMIKAKCRVFKSILRLQNLKKMFSLILSLVLTTYTVVYMYTMYL